MDYNTQDKIYEFNLQFGYCESINKMFLLNPHELIIILFSSTSTECFLFNLISNEIDYDYKNFGSNIIDLKKVKLNNFGESILEIGRNYIYLYYYDKNINKRIKEEIPKEKSPKKLNKTIEENIIDIDLSSLFQ